MIATIIDTKDLWQTVVAAMVAGVGITALFSLVIFGVARFADMRRDDRTLLAATYGALAAAAALATVAGIVLGMAVMLSK
jgi:hypothetical protein